MNKSIKYLCIAIGLGCTPKAEEPRDETERLADLEWRLVAIEQQIRDLQRENERLRERLGYDKYERTLDEMRKPIGPVRRGAPIADLRCEQIGDAFFLSRSDLDAVMGNLDAVAADVRLVPYFQNGVRHGVKLYSIRPESLPGSCGFRNGDIVLRVNGHELTSMESARDAHAKVREALRLDFAIERDGILIVLMIETT